MLKESKRIFLILFFLIGFVYGQEIVDFEADEVRYEVKKRSEVVVTVNGKPFPVKNYIELPKGKIFDVHIEGLKPNTYVKVNVKKLGTKVKNTKILANHVGVIDLEIRLPKQRTSGSAIVEYYTSDGKKHVRNITVKIK